MGAGRGRPGPPGQETQKAVDATAQDMDEKLERVQKSLDAYLESKRTAFPR